MLLLWLDACGIFSTIRWMWMRLKYSTGWGNITTYVCARLHYRWLLMQLGTWNYDSAFLAMSTVPSQVSHARRSFNAEWWLLQKGLGQLRQPSHHCRQWRMTSCSNKSMKPAGGTGGKQSFQVWYFDSVSREVTGLRHEFVEFIDSCWLHCPVYRCSLLHLCLQSTFNTGITLRLIRAVCNVGIFCLAEYLRICLLLFTQYSQ